MNLQDSKKLINNVIENEFQHIRETKELDDRNKDNRRVEQANEMIELLDRLLKDASEEYKKMLREYESLVTGELCDYSQYYFKEGVRAGTTNLEFLKDTNCMEYI